MTEYGRIHTDGSRSGGQPVLLPCPFCGETPTLQWHSAPECWVECSCGAIGPQGEDTSTDDHIALWNTRQPTQSDALQAENERLLEAIEQIAFSGADGPYGHFGEALNEYQMRRVARAAYHRSKTNV